MNKKYPEWFEEQNSQSFASRVISGVDEKNPSFGVSPHHSAEPSKKRRKLELEDYYRGIEKKDKSIFSRAITLVESNALSDIQIAQELIQRILPKTGNSLRIGITGIPGVGKSTFIDRMGEWLCGRGYHVAVLAIDPSSTISGGSILGDKTRMERLTKNGNAFIRPSPSGGVLGGVARKSRETVLLCEAFGFDVILIETVGVGQSETTVRSMTDCFLLLMITGAGDELQGFKKGIVELADIVIVNKADGENLQPSLLYKREMENVLHYLIPVTQGWKIKVDTCSSLSGEGIERIWADVLDYEKVTKKNGVFEKRRNLQSLEWVYSLLSEYLHNKFYHHPSIEAELPKITEAVSAGKMPTIKAVQDLIEMFEKKGG